ncbi:MAG TPA: vWA domain-containing protein [Polyangia bacterium]|jgi:hypothetical protein
MRQRQHAPAITRVLSTVLTVALAAMWQVGCSFTRAPATPDDGGTSSGDGSTSPPDVVVRPPDGGSTFETGSQTCVTTKPQTAALPPDVLILLDRSLSMAEDVNGNTCGAGCMNKWVQVTGAINSFVPTTESSVNWGLMFFGDARSSGVTCNAETTADVVPATGNATKIMAAIAGTSPGSSTPTTVALKNAAAYLKGLSDDNPKYILLATDGLPTCGATGATSADDANAIAQVKAVHDTDGIPTFVVGIATTGMGGDATLDQMAVNGGYPQAGTPQYYSISSNAELQTVLGTITSMVGTCFFGITPTLDPTKQTISGVNADGNPLSSGDYMTVGNTGIQLIGQACTDYTAGKLKVIEVQVQCVVG